MSEYKGLIVPPLGVPFSYEHLQEAYCEIGDCYTKEDTGIPCDECLFNYSNLDKFMQWVLDEN